MVMTKLQAEASARHVRHCLPAEGLFAQAEWRISPTPFALEASIHRELEELGRILLQFYRAVNLLYRQSTLDKQPAWIARWLDQGKPAALITLQRDPAFKNELPRVIRPDLLLTESGLVLVELDSIPGGIGLTAWLNQVYSELPHLESETEIFAGKFNPLPAPPTLPKADQHSPAVIGGKDGMLSGFAGIFGDARQVHIVVSEEAAMYRPEMQWLARTLDDQRFLVGDAHQQKFQPGDAVYRFFELFDLPNVPQAEAIFTAARAKQIRLTPPPKAFFEEKLLFALLWNRNLKDFWRRELGERFFKRLLELVPRTWLLDPTPLPPHAAMPGLDLTDWRQLKTLSQRERALILKISGFSEQAWGARGVHLGSDLSQADWSTAVDKALDAFPTSPYVLQRFHKPKTVSALWYDFAHDSLQTMNGRVRLCPYYFQAGEDESARALLGGVLATLCPSDKKIIHGMKDAILAPCVA
jgi:hypothetical protein